MPYELEFFEEANGRVPVLEWLNGLSQGKQEAARHALAKILGAQGTGVCQSEWGKALKGGLFEFRIRHDANEILRQMDPVLAQRVGTLASEPTLLRVFFTVRGNKIVLLLGGYDKGKDSSRKRQDAEIGTARARLRVDDLRQRSGSVSPGQPFRAWWIDRARELEKWRRNR